MRKISATDDNESRNFEMVSMKDVVARLCVYPFGVFLGIICWCLPHSVLSEHLIQTINGTIFAEEYNYYRIDGAGRLRVELISWAADADLYVSDITLHPTYENYELKSTTCGIDFVDIPPTFQRPVGVGVYGYPSKNETHYSLSVYFVSSFDDKSYKYLDTLYNRYDQYNEDSADMNIKSNKMNRQNSRTDNATPGESISETLWTILLTILKVFIEIIL